MVAFSEEFGRPAMIEKSNRRRCPEITLIFAELIYFAMIIIYN